MKSSRILIVSGNAPILDILLEWFENLNGCPTVTARNSDDVLEILTWNPIDVVITGINQLGLNGIELTKEICRQGGPPVIVYTKDYSEENRKAATRAGAKAFLKKPAPLEKLLETVAQVVGEDSVHNG